jgi:hypothetical protein
VHDLLFHRLPHEEEFFKSRDRIPDVACGAARPDIVLN